MINDTRQIDSHGKLQRIGIAGGFFSVCLMVLFSFFGCEENIPVPQQLIGEWKTSAPQYEDRYLKIAGHSVTFGIGDGEEVSHDIEKVTAGQENGESAYTIRYKDKEGETWSLTLIYSAASGGTIKLKNSNVIWEKAGAESPAS